MDYELVDNESAKRYEFHIDGFIAQMEYIKAQDKIYLTHTEVPTQLEGRGIASALAKKVLADVEAKNLILVPKCSFVTTYVKRHPEWEKLIAKDTDMQ